MKFTQIAVAGDGGSHVLYALSRDGTLWRYRAERWAMVETPKEPENNFFPTQTRGA